MKNQEADWLLKEKYHSEKTDGFLADCARLEAGEPLAYVIGSIPFLDCVIHLDSRPLIPRPETEFWVEQAIAVIKSAQGSPRQRLGEPWASVRVLDLCAGSGAIGVAVAKAIPDAHITFAEIDPAHAPTIKKNITENLPFEWKVLEKKYSLISSDLFDNISQAEKYDFILSNPPYIDTAANTVTENVTTHEPHLALFGGTDGLELIAKIIVEAPSYLSDSGQLWLEHEPFQAEAIKALGTTHGFNTLTYPDQYATLRYSVLSKSVPK